MRQICLVLSQNLFLTAPKMKPTQIGVGANIVACHGGSKVVSMPTLWRVMVALRWYQRQNCGVR